VSIEARDCYRQPEKLVEMLRRAINPASHKAYTIDSVSNALNTIAIHWVRRACGDDLELTQSRSKYTTRQT
jgi:hypothetical protein